MQKEEAIQLCRKHLHRYVMVQTRDGMAYDGIVENVDEENVYLAVPVAEQANAYPEHVNAYPGHANAYPGQANVYPEHAGVLPAAMMDGRPDGAAFGYGYPGFGYPGYGFGFPGYGFPGYGYFPRRRFRRLILPLTLLAGLSLLPYY